MSDSNVWTKDQIKKLVDRAIETGRMFERSDRELVEFIESLQNSSAQTMDASASKQGFTDLNDPEVRKQIVEEANPNDGFVAAVERVQDNFKAMAQWDHGQGGKIFAEGELGRSIEELVVMTKAENITKHREWDGKDKIRSGDSLLVGFCGGALEPCEIDYIGPSIVVVTYKDTLEQLAASISDCEFVAL